MKTLMISESDISGGAALAAFRLHKGLISKGMQSRLLVQNKLTIDHSIIGPTSNLEKGFANIRTSLDHLPKLFYRNRDETVFHLQWIPDFFKKKIVTSAIDIIHLHWICRGFVNISTLSRIKKPIVWTFHDMWPFTGGCHYTDDCIGYQKGCGKCPQLGSKGQKDISWMTLRRK